MSEQNNEQAEPAQADLPIKVLDAPTEKQWESAPEVEAGQTTADNFGDVLGI